MAESDLGDLLGCNCFSAAYFLLTAFLGPKKSHTPTQSPQVSSLASSSLLAGVGGRKAQPGSFSLGLALAHLLLRLAKRGGHLGLCVPWARTSIGSFWDLNSRSPAQPRDLRLEGEAAVEQVTNHLRGQFSGE